MLSEDEQLIHELYLHYYRSVWYFAFSLLGHYDDAEDVTQETFLELARHVKKISAEPSYKRRAYLVSIVRSRTYNLLSRKTRDKRHMFSLDAIENLEIQDDGETPEEYVLRIDNYEYAGRLLAQVRDLYRIPMILRYTFDYTDEEIPENMGIKKQNVRVYWVFIWESFFPCKCCLLCFCRGRRSFQTFRALG